MQCTWMLTLGINVSDALSIYEQDNTCPLIVVSLKMTGYTVSFRQHLNS